MTDRPLHDEVLSAAHDAVLDIALAALLSCDHDRQHRSAGCRACQMLSQTTTWLISHRALEADARALLRDADVIARDAWMTGLTAS